VLTLMDDAFACRNDSGGWSADRRRRAAEDLSLTADADLQVAALFSSAVHLIKV